MIELHQTQYPGTDNKPKRAIFVGLDFGTAYTKVVIAGASDSFAIKLRPELSGIDAYLQPGVLTISNNGVYQLASGREQSSYVDNLKLALIQQPDNSSARINAAVFLACILQKARKRFMEEQTGIFGNYQLVWHLNIGLPAANYEDVALKNAFHWIAELGWMLSVLDRPLTTKDEGFLKGILQPPKSATDPVLDTARDRFIHTERVGILPEVQAVTVSYAASRSRQNCLHLLVDVGAGTLDINLFGLVDLGTEHRYVCHAAKVLPLGAVYLAQHRLKQFQEKGLITNSSLANQFSTLASLPTRGELARQFRISEDKIERMDGPFLNQVGTSICDAINDIRRKYGNRVFPFFSQPLPAFIGGGGAEDPAYTGRLKKVSKDTTTAVQKGLAINKLPMPERILMPDLSADHFHRLAVAYGLTHDVVNLGDYINLGKGALEYEILAPSYRENFIAKELT